MLNSKATLVLLLFIILSIAFHHVLATSNPIYVVAYIFLLAYSIRMAWTVVRGA